MNKKTKRSRGGQKNVTMKDKPTCNPSIKSKRVSKTSCYTDDVLNKIKKAYNKSHSQDKQITSTKPDELLSDLEDKLDHCEKEDCWLKEITDPDTRREINQMTFAPKKPSEWKQDPNAWLSNFDIAAVLRQYEKAHTDFKLLGPSSIDYDTKLKEDGGRCVWDDLCKLSLQKLLKQGKTKLGIVFNLDKHDQPGSHWVSMFVDLEDGIIFYYDSAMNTVPTEITRLKDEIISQGKQLDNPIKFKYIKNKIAHQDTNTECGMFSLFFIVTFLTKKIDKRIFTELKGGGCKSRILTNKDVVRLFTKPTIDDDIMIQYRNIFFN